MGVAQHAGTDVDRMHLSLGIGRGIGRGGRTRRAAQIEDPRRGDVGEVFGEQTDDDRGLAVRTTGALTEGKDVAAGLIQRARDDVVRSAIQAIAARLEMDVDIGDFGRRLVGGI
jgi:hypothetical protein